DWWALQARDRRVDSLEEVDPCVDGLEAQVDGVEGRVRDGRGPDLVEVGRLVELGAAGLQLRERQVEAGHGLSWLSVQRVVGVAQLARKPSRSCRVMTPTGSPSPMTSSASAFWRAARAASIVCPTPMSGIGAPR